MTVKDIIKDKLRQPRWNITLFSFVIFELLLLVGGIKSDFNVITSFSFQSILVVALIFNFIIFKYYIEPNMDKQHEEERKRKQEQKRIYEKQNLEYAEYVGEELGKKINEQNSLATQLKNILDNMTQEEFDKVWSIIVSQKLEGPTFSEVNDYYKNKKQNED